MIEVLLLSVAFMLVAFVLFGIRLLFVKKGEFRGTCAGNSPFMNKEGVSCGICGAKPGETCAKDENEKPTVQNQA